MNLLRWMVREEWRLHSRLFGSRGFALFPVVIMVLSGLAYLLLGVSGYSIMEIQHGLHYVAIFLGLNVGSVGFVSRDAFKNLLGESSLLVFSSRTQPVSRHRIVATFVLKDLIYYSFLYLTPLVLAFVPVAFYLQQPSSPLLVWWTLTGSFALGVSVSFLAAALYTKNKLLLAPPAILLGIAVAVYGFDLVYVTPISFYLNPEPVFLLSFLLPLPLVGIGLLSLELDAGRGSRTREERFSVVNSRFGKPLLTKMLLDVLRSSGGVLKLLVSIGVLFGLFVFLVEYIPLASRIVSSPGIAVAVLLGVSSVSVYHWINMFDERGEYLYLPCDTEDVLGAKALAHFVYALPTSYLYLFIGGAWFGYGEIVIGIAILPLVSLYVFGVAIYLTGTDPDELLFDASLFLVFSVAVSICAIPLFVASFVYTAYPSITPLFSLSYSALAGFIGLVLYRGSLSRWD